MKYIPIEVVRDILNKCYYVNPEAFVDITIDVDEPLSQTLSEVIENILDKDSLVIFYADWALNELKGVEYDDGNTE